MADKEKMDPFFAGLFGFVGGAFSALLIFLLIGFFVSRSDSDLPKMKPIAQGETNTELLLRYEDPETGHTVYVARRSTGGVGVAVVPKETK